MVLTPGAKKVPEPGVLTGVNVASQASVAVALGHWAVAPQSVFWAVTIWLGGHVTAGAVLSRTVTVKEQVAVAPTN